LGIGLLAAIWTPVQLATSRSQAARMPGGPRRFRRAFYLNKMLLCVPMFAGMAVCEGFDSLTTRLIVAAMVGGAGAVLAGVLINKVASWRILLQDLAYACKSPHSDQNWLRPG
jgi:hypothetical protein